MSLEVSSDGSPNGDGPLTASQEHYLKKELINLQLHKEFQKLSVTYNDVTGLRKFGPPFAPYDPANPPLDYQQSLRISMAYVDHFDQAFPFMRHFFNNFLITFPFISQYQKLSDQNNNEQFWVNKVQKSYEIWKSKKISNSNDRGELSKRKLALFKIIKFLLMMYNSALPTTTDEEYLLENGKKDKNAYKKLSKVLPIEELSLEDVLNEEHFYNGIEISIVGLRTNKELKTIRSLNNSIQYLNFWSTNPKEENLDKRYSKFYEFLIHVKIESTGEDFYIARRYSEFQKLNQQLFKKFAGKNLPKLPSKIKQNSEVDYNDDGTGNASIYSEDDEFYEDDMDSVLSEGAMSNIEKDFANTLKLSSANAHVKKSANAFSHIFVKDKQPKPPKSPKSPKSPKGSFSGFDGGSNSVKLPREKLRVALRGYLNQLIKLPMVRNSNIFLAFISKDKFPEITSQVERMDINLRRKMDVFVVAQQLLFQKETIKTIQDLQVNIETLKEELLDGPENLGFSMLFNELEQKETINQLSLPLRSFVDLTKIEIASTLYELFVASDQAVELFKILKKMHQFFPYKLVATILRFTNPMLVMKKLIDLFLIQPPTFNGNGKSLLQFIFTLILNDDVKQLNKEITVLTENITRKSSKYKILITKIEDYMENKNDDLVIAIKKNSARFNIDLVLAILMNNNDLKMIVPDEVLMEVLESYRSFKRLQKLHADEVEVDSDQRELYNFISKRAELFTYLNDLFKAMLRKRDKDNLKELWDEPELTKLIKELITIFFQPLIKIFTEADIYLYVPIFKDFINDLIALVSAYQSNYSMILSGNSNVVAKFVDLLTKYQNHMYTFIRNLYISDKNSSEDSRVFTKLVDWFNSFLVLLRYVKNNRPDLKIDMNRLVKNLIEGGIVNQEKLILEVDRIVKGIDAKREQYKKILEEEPAPLQQEDRETNHSKINNQWTDIHKNLSSAMNFTSDELPIHDFEMDELNMELVDLNMNKKVNYIEQFNDADFLTYTTQYEMNRKIGKYVDDAEFTGEEDGFENLNQDSEIKKLLGDFAKTVYPILKETKEL